MAEVQPAVCPEPDADLVDAAKAQKIPEYTKNAIAHTRHLLQHGTVSQNEFSLVENSNSVVPPFPPLTDLDGLPMLEEVNMLEVPTNDNTTCASKLPQEDGVLDVEERVKFQSIERWYNQLKKPSMTDQVRYEAAKRNFDIWNKRTESQRYIQEENEERFEDQDSDYELFVRQTEPAHTLAQGEPSVENDVQSEDTPIVGAPNKRKPKNRISAEEKRISKQVGFEQIRAKLQGKKKRGRPANKSNSTSTKDGNMPTQEMGRKRKRNNDEPNALLNLHTNMVEEAHASSALPAPESFTARDKQKALAQLVASIPSTDQEQVIDDKIRLLKALKKFNNKVRSDGNGGWKMKGLKTSMYNYQVLGCAFMRDRENAPEKPWGGLLCDVMGIGKTFEALVNIVDGVPSDPEDPVKTTLLVLPSHLVKHWKDQIIAHCDLKAIGKVVEYHAQAKLSTLDDVESLQDYRIVITTYDEVRRSYPTFKPPTELADEKILQEQWDKMYEEERGPLHRIKFRRVVLDEAHMIKNKNSSVSIAVRGLTGHYKWILSGTPVMNSNEEFYPLFAFIGLSQIGDYADFVSYYCNDKEGKQRLSNLLRTYMYRRTHSSRLFSLPIIKLPDIREETINIEFSEAEWVLYEGIEEEFMNKINNLMHVPNAKLEQTRCILTMYLRLRMFCSHLLTVQNLIKYLLRSESVMKRLNRLLREGRGENSDSSFQIVTWLRAVKKDYKTLVQQREAEDHDKRGENQIFNDNTDLLDRFHEFMSQLHSDEEWLDRYDRGVCPNCNLVPDKPVVTSCMHLYCEECFSKLHNEVERIEAEKPGPQISERAKPICLKCVTPIDEATCGGSGISGEKMEQENPLVPVYKNRRQELTRAKRKAKKNGILTERAITSTQTDLDADSSEDADDDEDNDWVLACGAKMPGAKLTGIRDTIKRWKSENKDAKVVIFSLFTDFIRILADMCEEEKWGYRCLTGKMRIPVRHKYLEDFKKSKNVTILIVSLHTGGTGLDMTVAHKCIIVDLWWNEAVQNQAFCRLLRHGQTQNVECVKMVVKGSIDDYLLHLQGSKTEDINSTMGDDILKKRDTIIRLLKLFADVNEDEKGQLYVKPLPRKGRMKEIVSQRRPTREANK